MIINYYLINLFRPRPAPVEELRNKSRRAHEKGSDIHLSSSLNKCAATPLKLNFCHIIVNISIRILRNTDFN